MKQKQMREGYEEESEDMVEQQMECQEFSLKKTPEYQ